MGQVKSQFYLSFWRPDVHFVRQGCDGHLRIAILLHRRFWRPTSISCERVAMDTSESQFYFTVFDVQRPFRAKGLRWATTKIAILHQFSTSNVHFVRKSCDGPSKIAILPQFLTSNLHFARTGLHVTPLNHNFTTAFDVQRPFRVKALRWTTLETQFYTSFWRPTSISCERVAMGHN